MNSRNDIERYQDLVQQSVGTIRSNANKIAQEKLSDTLKGMGIDTETIPVGAHLIQEGLTGGATEQIRRKVLQKVQDKAPDAIKTAIAPIKEKLANLGTRVREGVSRVTSATRRGVSNVANRLTVTPRTLNIQEGNYLHAEPIIDDMGPDPFPEMNEAVASRVVAAPLLEEGEGAVDAALLATDVVDQEIPLLDVITDVATLGAGITTLVTGAVEGAKASNAPLVALKTTVESYAQQFGR